MKTKVLLADDHTLVRQGLRQIIETGGEFEVVAEAGTGVEAVALAARESPDVAVMDIGMPELNGIEATTQILKKSPRTVVLILSMHNDERYVLRAVKAGARGYLLKNSAGDELMAALKAVRQGLRYFSPAVVPPDSDAQVEDRYELLTDRERHIYQLLAEGNSNKDVANRLNLSLHTVETHRARIMEKLGLHTPAELVLSAVRRGIVS